MLKSEARRVATDLKNKKKQKKRALRRCATLQTRDIVQVLLERGVVIPSTDTETVSGGASSSGERAPAEAADMEDIPPPDAIPAIADAPIDAEGMADAIVNIA